MSIRSSSYAAAAALCLVLSLPALPAAAGNETEPKGEDIGREGEAGLGVAAGLLSIVYAPAKVLYAAGGGLVAGLAYALSAGDQEVMEPILTPALRGDYVVTPAHLRGERPLEFIGREPEDRADHREASASGDGLDAAPSVSSNASEASAPTIESQ